jgi:hypothetical protein
LKGHDGKENYIMPASKLSFFTQMFLASVRLQSSARLFTERLSIMGIFDIFLVALCVSASSAVRITSVKHSGSACPQGSSVAVSGPYDDLRLTLNGFKANLPDADSCLVTIQLDQGPPGKVLVLDEASVQGALSLSAGSDVTFYHTAFWSETAGRTVSRT